MTNTMTRLQQAKARFCLSSVFFPMLVMGTHIEAREDVDTMATDGQCIYYNETYVNEQTIDVIIALLAHEILHIVLKHCFRRGTRDIKLWNVAADLQVNGVLVANGFKLWAGAFHDTQFAGMSVETIYDLLVQSGGANGGKCPEGNGGTGPDLREPKGLTPGDVEKIEQRIREKVASAATQARLAGKLPAGLDRLVGELLTAVVPWEAVLAEYMQTLMAKEESWSRRNRRYIDFRLPSMSGVTMGELVVIGDTSGSCHYDKGYYERIGGELSYICDQVKPERVRVIWADYTPCGLEEVFEQGDDIALHPKGGGGTDMRKPLLYVNQYEPVVVILITDCETPWPDEHELDYPLLVLSINDKEGPKWATTIHVKL